MEINGKLLDNEPYLNGRFYSKESISKAISEYDHRVKQQTSFGELDRTISMSNVSHIIEDVNETENGIYGTIRILDTPKGKLVKEMIRDGVNHGISVRTIKNGDELKILSFDLVSDPNKQTGILSIEPKIEDDDTQFEEGFEDE